MDAAGHREKSPLVYTQRREIRTVVHICQLPPQPRLSKATRCSVWYRPALEYENWQPPNAWKPPQRGREKVKVESENERIQLLRLEEVCVYRRDKGLKQIGQRAWEIITIPDNLARRTKLWMQTSASSCKDFYRVSKSSCDNFHPP